MSTANCPPQPGPSVRLLLALLLPGALALAGCDGAGAPRWADPARLGPPSAAEQNRRGAVEVFVKSNHTALIDEIGAGGGPTLTRAFDIAGVPAADRPARVIQLDANLGLHAASPAALIRALLLYGDVAGA
jgi:hypothetical protein